MGNVLVFVSIVIGLGVTDILVSLHRLLRARAQVRWDWAALAVAFLVLLTIVQMWWTIAQPSAKSMTIGAFLPMLVELVLLFLLASAVLPDSLPPEGIDLKAYYHDNGGYIWTLFAAALAWLVATDFVVTAPRLGIRASLGRSAEEFIVLAVMVSLIFVRRRWWHAIGLCVLAGGPIGWLSRSLS
jgi:hypothetical protein